jgi:hypothetical protein
LKNQRFFNRQICVAAQIRGFSAEWGINVNNEKYAQKGDYYELSIIYFQTEMSVSQQRINVLVLPVSDHIGQLLLFCFQ